jgi:hypothetical protein
MLLPLAQRLAQRPAYIWTWENLLVPDEDATYQAQSATADTFARANVTRGTGTGAGRPR